MLTPVGVVGAVVGASVGADVGAVGAVVGGSRVVTQPFGQRAGRHVEPFLTPVSFGSRWW